MTQEELEAKVVQLEGYVVALLTQVVPPLQAQIKTLTEQNANLSIMYDEWLTSSGKFAQAAPRKSSKGRQPITFANWLRVMELLNAGKNYSDIAEETGIPNTTVRKYTKMDDAEVNALKAAAEAETVTE